MLIKNGTVYDAIHKRPYVADIAVERGKIKAIAPGLKPAKGERVVDATGLRVYPGFVEAHSHIGLTTFADGAAGADINETTSPVTPELRAIDSLNPQSLTFRYAREAGITTVCTGPGSANVIGGTFTAVKPVGNSVEEMLIKEAVAMKCAFGENPKKTYPKKGATVRMGVAARMRETLFAAQEYLKKKEAGKDQKFDLKMESLIPVLKGEMPLKAHAHRADDILTAIRIAKEFGQKLTIEHGTDGALIANELKKAKVSVALGPILCGGTKTELQNKTDATAAVLDKAGVPFCIITDSSVIMPQYLVTSAAVCARAGLDPFRALQAITINAAKHIGLEDRVGSLEVGKDADIVLCDGDVLSYTSRIKAVFIDGRKVV